MVNQRLHPSLLGSLNPQVQRPGYERSAHGIGVVHLGVGAFHRAHQALYLDDLLARAGGDWRILGISCRGPGVRDQLRPQDCLYTVFERSGSAPRMRLVGSIADVWVAAENPAAVIDAIARASTHVISLTVTEKGYCRSPSGDGLDLQHPDIVHDLTSPARARSALGLLAAGLRQRWQRRIGPPTIISCDNLPHNGALLQRLLVEFARQLDPGLAEWIANEVACPSSVVDRIVPATTDADISAAATALGLTDQAVVITEPFTQWIIEDHFAGPRPELELAGVRLVADVRPYESAKLRLLNGSHSALAYLGVIADLHFVHEAMAEPEVLAFVRHLMAGQLAPTLAPTPGLDLAAYQAALLARFANPALQHRLQQIAMDGSQKLPQRLVQPARECIASGNSFDALALAIAAWMRYTLGRTERGVAYAIDDPLAARLASIAASNLGSGADLAARFLAVEEIFGADLRHHAPFVAAVSRQLEQLLAHGALAAMRRLRLQRNG
jgi:fructuronate reductase